MAIALADETLEQEVVRLRRELAHIQEQSRVAHAMAMDYRERYRIAEQQRAQLERKLNHRRRSRASQ